MNETGRKPTTGRQSPSRLYIPRPLTTQLRTTRGGDRNVEPCEDSNRQHIGSRSNALGISCTLILTLNSVGCTRIYLWSSCDARLMYTRMIDLTGCYLRCNFIKHSQTRDGTGNACLTCFLALSKRDLQPLLWDLFSSPSIQLDPVRLWRRSHGYFTHIFLTKAENRLSKFICRRSVVTSGWSGVLHQWNWHFIIIIVVVVVIITIKPPPPPKKVNTLTS